MSGVIEVAGPVEAPQDDFDRQWLSAQSGHGVDPGQGRQPAEPVDSTGSQSSGAPAPVSGQSQGGVDGAPAATAQQAPAQFQLPSEYQERLKQVGAKSLDELFEFGRGYQSVKGQLPNLEQKWRQQYVAPLEQELNRYREERQQAIEDFVRVDPVTGRARTPQEQERVRQQLADEERQQTEQRTKTEKEAQLEQREQRVATAEESLLRHGIRESIAQYKTQLAKTHNVPVAEIDQYIKNTRFMERLGDMPDLTMFQHFIIELADQSEAIANSLQERRQAEAAAKYRDVGNNAGGQGGQQSGDRWQRTTEGDFDKAWEAALAGRLT